MHLRDVTPWRFGELPRWDQNVRPFEAYRTEIDMLHRDMDRLFKNMWQVNGEYAVMPEMFGFGEVAPLVDEVEDEAAYHFSIELPGMTEKDIDVTLVDGMLTIRGEKKLADEFKGVDYFRKERRFGAFRRTLPVPGEVDETKIKASFKQGILWIDLPKTEAAQKKVKHISVMAA